MPACMRLPIMELSVAPAGDFSKRIDAATMTDEIGIEAGRYGPYVLKTAYQAVFHNAPDGPAPYGVAGSTIAYRDGQPVSWQSFLEQVPPADHGLIDAISHTLQLRNHRNIGVDGLAIHYRLENRMLEDPAGHIGELMRTLEDFELDPSLLVCELPTYEDEHEPAELAKLLHEKGIRIAVAGFGTDRAAISRMRLLDPQIVKLDSEWFRRIAEVPMASRLLGSLVGTIQRDGRQVLIADVHKTEHLQSALDAGADFLQGDLLRRALLAGAIFDTECLNVRALLGAEENVVPLFARQGKSN